MTEVNVYMITLKFFESKGPMFQGHVYIEK